MLWIGVGVAVFAGVVVLVLNTVAKRSAHDLGSVSARWIVEHRAES